MRLNNILGSSLLQFACLGLLTASLTCSSYAAPPTSSDSAILRNYAQTKGFSLGRPQKPKFAYDAKSVLFLRSEPNDKTQKLFRYDIATKQASLLVDPATLLGGQSEELSAEEKARRERQRLYTGGFADFYVCPQADLVLLPLSGKLYLLDGTSGQTQKLEIEGSVTDPKWSPDGKKIAYVKGFDVFVYDVAKKHERALTSGGSAELTHGIAEFVAQEEMRRYSGFWWNPESTRIAFTEADHKGVEAWYISDPSRPDKAPQKQFYPRPGQKNVAVRLGLVSIAPEESYPVTWIAPPQGMEYLAAVHWDKQGPLTVQWQDRGQKKLRLCQIDPYTGASETLLEETDPAWVNIHHNLPAWTAGAKQFLFYRNVGGYERLTLHNPKGQTVRQVIDNPSEVSEFEGLEIEDELETRVTYALDPKTGNPDTSSVILDEKGAQVGKAWSLIEGGVQSVVTSPRSQLRMVTQHTLKDLPTTRLFDAEGNEAGRLPSVAVEPEQELNFESYKLSTPAATLNAAVIRPKNFTKGKKYPVIVDVYGGPHKIQVSSTRKNWVVDQWLADQGFVVVAIDNRGTPHRGIAFETAVYGKFDSVPLEDQCQGLTALSRQIPEMDMKRVGIFGWSFGGFLSAQAVLKRPDVFKAAVAGAPVTDWEDYDTHYTERYLGLLPEAKAAYDNSSLAPLAKDLSRPLLLIHGTADDNVYFRNSLKLGDALFKEGKDFEMLPLPGITHSYSSDPLTTERVLQKTVMFFKRSL